MKKAVLFYISLSVVFFAKAQMVQFDFDFKIDPFYKNIQTVYYAFATNSFSAKKQIKISNLKGELKISLKDQKSVKPGNLYFVSSLHKDAENPSCNNAILLEPLLKFAKAQNLKKMQISTLIDIQKNCTVEAYVEPTSFEVLLSGKYQLQIADTSFAIELLAAQKNYKAQMSKLDEHYFNSESGRWTYNTDTKQVFITRWMRENKDFGILQYFKKTFTFTVREENLYSEEGTLLKKLY